jgi:hypothetical protein
MNNEELVEQMHHEVTGHFKPKVLEKRVLVDPVEAEKLYNCFRDIAKRPVNVPSDYECTQIRAHQRMRQCGKGVP